MPRPAGPPGFWLWREQSPRQNTARSHLRALLGWGYPGDFRPHQLSPDPQNPVRGREGGRGGAISSPGPVREPRLAAGGVRGGGPRRRAHPTPAASSPHRAGFVSALSPRSPDAAAEPPEGGRARRGGSAAGHVSAGGKRAPGAARRQPGHRGARIPPRGAGVSGGAPCGAQGPGWSHRAAGSGCRVAAPDWLQHGRRRGQGGPGMMLRGGSPARAPAAPAEEVEKGSAGQGSQSPAGERS